MHKISQAEMSSQLCKLVQHTLSSHEPVQLAMENGQSAVLLSEQDYQQLLHSLSQIQAIVAQAASYQTSRKPRAFGSSRGLIEMSDDFDAPLDDFQDYM